MVQVTVPSQTKEEGPKNMDFLTLFEKLVKINVFVCLLAITASLFRFHQNKKKIGTFTLHLPSPTTFIFGLSADAAYFILEVAIICLQKFCNYFCRLVILNLFVIN